MSRLRGWPCLGVGAGASLLTSLLLAADQSYRARPRGRSAVRARRGRRDRAHRSWRHAGLRQADLPALNRTALPPRRAAIQREARDVSPIGKICQVRETPAYFTYPPSRGPDPEVMTSIKRPADATLSVTRAARLIGVHPNTIRAWSDQGRLSFLRINDRGDRRYRLADLQRFLAEAETKREPARGRRGPRSSSAAPVAPSIGAAAVEQRTRPSERASADPTAAVRPMRATGRPRGLAPTSRSWRAWPTSSSRTSTRTSRCGPRSTTCTIAPGMASSQSWSTATGVS
jgi:excisionase family DNA binding protein